MKWNTDEMIRLLSQFGKVTPCEQWSEITSRNIVVEAEGAAKHNQIYVTGFITGDTELNGNDCEIEMIEVSDGQDSRGGLNTDDEPTCVLYAKIVSALRKKGFSVVPQMKNYF